MRDIIIIATLAMICGGCTSLRYDLTVTTYSDRVVDHARVRRDSIWQEVSFQVHTNGTLNYSNDGGNGIVRAAVEAAIAAGQK